MGGTRIGARVTHTHTGGKLYGHHLQACFCFRPNRRRYRFDKPSFRKRVRYSNVFGMVRSTRGHADGGVSERE